MSALATGLVVVSVVLVIVFAVTAGGRWLRRRMLDPPGVKAAAQALRTAGLAAPPLREGLTGRSAAQALPYLLALLETPGWHCVRRTGPCSVHRVRARTMPMT